ncbi:uncharacterized protein LY89DRAFT_688334 [Mollisia scopiformis]|uniref:Uncharacterized protein n=1 Tax=Mollisia scopiformis TaxID=149040 RepID=A0A194WW71_MOLSC|nr:uncharacterized protein LY89DRAFT_688334 [Mollisia scopiformis]KUJ11832.1 hypothetical protein LY89DRAFT_688334 [Mollisia scopiformis]
MTDFSFFPKTRTNNFSALPYRAVSEITSLPATIVHMGKLGLGCNYHTMLILCQIIHTTVDIIGFGAILPRMKPRNMPTWIQFVAATSAGGRLSSRSVCDCRTISMSSLVQGDLVTPRTISENCWVRYNPEQQWYWLSDQSPDEVTLFLQFDFAIRGKR